MTANRACGVIVALCVLGVVVLIVLGVPIRVTHSHLKEKVIIFNGHTLHCITDQGHIATCDWVRYHNEGS